MWVYYDESGEYGPDGRLRNMSIGGCAAPLDRWKSFEIAWLKALSDEGLTYFHMTDFEAWVHPFDFALPDGTRDKEKHNRLLNALLSVMLDHVDFFGGFAAGNLISSDPTMAHELALEDCVLAAITYAVHDLWEKRERPINRVFGKQRHFSYAKIMKYVELYGWGEGRGRLGSVTVDEPKVLPPLQAADILAYEMAKVQRERPVRYPFIRLRDESKARGIPMTLKWGPFIRISDRVAARMRGEPPS
jgi:hypothetical protein